MVTRTVEKLTLQLLNLLLFRHLLIRRTLPRIVSTVSKRVSEKNYCIKLKKK